MTPTRPKAPSITKDFLTRPPLTTAPVPASVLPRRRGAEPATRTPVFTRPAPKPPAPTPPPPPAPKPSPPAPAAPPPAPPTKFNPATAPSKPPLSWVPPAARKPPAAKVPAAPKPPEPPPPSRAQKFGQVISRAAGGILYGMGLGESDVEPAPQIDPRPTRPALAPPDFRYPATPHMMPTASRPAEPRQPQHPSPVPPPLLHNYDSGRDVPQPMDFESYP